MSHERDTAEDGMYGRHAELYDLIYHWKDYAAEAEALREILHEEGIADGARLLEAACGTGNFLVELARWYAVTGLDLSEPLLSIARDKVPQVELIRADMQDFEVEKRFDALLCLFGSIGYVLTAEALDRTARAFARSLRTGGVLIVEPWVAPEEWRAGHVHQHVYESEDVQLCRQAHGERNGELATLEFQWLAGRRGVGIEHFVEHHVTWLCPRATMKAAFERAGFEMHLDPKGLRQQRGLFVGRKRATGPPGP